MNLRDRTGGITPAEGCMFAAMGFFALLLIALLVIAFIRFQSPPNPAGMGPRSAAPQEAVDPVADDGRPAPRGEGRLHV